jgi:hypothetical protein
VALLGAVEPLPAQEKKPNIIVIMGDDIGMWNLGAYSRGMMAGRTPNLDKIAKEGMLFTDYYAEASFNLDAVKAEMAKQMQAAEAASHGTGD